jgi:hypothetical protein
VLGKGARRRAEPGANVENAPADKRRDRSRPVSLPVIGRREELELIANVVELGR